MPLSPEILEGKIQCMTQAIEKAAHFMIESSKQLNRNQHRLVGLGATTQNISDQLALEAQKLRDVL